VNDDRTDLAAAMGEEKTLMVDCCDEVVVWGFCSAVEDCEESLM
jgi:hypothetical protein